MSAPAKWTHKDEWRLSGKDFLITVEHREAPTRVNAFGERDGGHSWCVYAYIYPKHPLFAKFDGDSIWQEATEALPLHGGCSLLRYCRGGKDAEVTAVQVGADYSHLHDHYAHDDASGWERSGPRCDAEKLHAALTAMVPP